MNKRQPIPFSDESYIVAELDRLAKLEKLVAQSKKDIDRLRKNQLKQSIKNAFEVAQ